MPRVTDVWRWLHSKYFQYMENTVFATVLAVMNSLTMFCSSVAVFGAEIVVTDKITVTMDGETMTLENEIPKLLCLLFS